MKARLNSISVTGFKTWNDLPRFHLGNLTVLLGPNGAGKSNLISIFSLLHRTIMQPSELDLYVAEAGGASRLLHLGASTTRTITIHLEVARAGSVENIKVLLGYSSGDALYFQGWSVSHFAASDAEKAFSLTQKFPRDAADASLPHDPDALNSSASFLRDTSLRGLLPYQFHDTSFTSGLRRKSSIGNNQYLQRDGSNLAAMLYRLSTGDEAEREALRRIHEMLRLLLPFFAEFSIQPQHDYVLLQWRERGSDEIFSASQASDGMLRLFALVTLLLQPPDWLPALLLLDEPELGLHPQAITVLAALIRQASKHCQVILATQSVPLVDEFRLEEIVVIDRKGRESTLRRLNSADYEVWLDEYSSGELWRKNVLAGGPAE